MVHARLNRTVGNPVAKAAIDMAIWDAIGQTLGASVTELLGGFTDRVRVSHMVGFARAEEMVAEAERIRATYGITTFKVKVGRRPYRHDVEAVRALRAAMPDVEIYIDGNRGWTASESARALRRDGRPRPHLRRGALPGRRRTRPTVAGRALLHPMYADESVPTPADVTRELLAGAATGISIKTSRTGFTTSQRILGQCEGMGIEVYVGNQIDTQIGSLCAAAFAAAYPLTARRPAELSNFLDMSDDLLAVPLLIEEVSSGSARAPGSASR